mmetsp:Transcript_9580/g.13856  ORF Transcript_9580/g.13856 Transcript_9580/m.13856 type:complete len:91 (+) Transcript_9580:105-377(+)
MRRLMGRAMYAKRVTQQMELFRKEFSAGFSMEWQCIFTNNSLQLKHFRRLHVYRSSSKNWLSCLADTIRKEDERLELLLCHEQWAENQFI